MADNIEELIKLAQNAEPVEEPLDLTDPINQFIKAFNLRPGSSEVTYDTLIRKFRNWYKEGKFITSKVIVRRLGSKFKKYSNDYERGILLNPESFPNGELELQELFYDLKFIHKKRQERQWQLKRHLKRQFGEKDRNRRQKLHLKKKKESLIKELEQSILDSIRDLTAESNKNT